MLGAIIGDIIRFCLRMEQYQNEGLFLFQEGLLFE